VETSYEFKGRAVAVEKEKEGGGVNRYEQGVFLAKGSKSGPHSHGGIVTGEKGCVYPSKHKNEG